MKQANAKVLIADDEQSITAGLSAILSDEGYAVEIAPDGQKALDRLSEDRFGVVLADLKMPKLDGLAVIRALRAAPATSDLPVLLLNLDEGDTRDGFAAGADDYMTKPFTPAQIRSRVERWLLRSRSANGKKRHPVS